MEQSLVPKLGFDSLIEAQQNFGDTGAFSNTDLEILHSFFGEHFILAAELLDKCCITEYKLANNLRNIFKIVTSKEQYTIFDNINFCHCSIFRYQVLEMKNAITCKHVLAVRIGKSMGKVFVESVTASQLVDFLNEQLNFIEPDNE